MTVVVARSRVWTREDCGLKPARRARSPLVDHPEGAIIHCTDGKHPTTEAEALKYWRLTQRFHQRSRGWNDIGYSFGFNELGMILEGGGWDKCGAHSNAIAPEDGLAWNADRHGFCYQGDGENPSQLAIDAMHFLLGAMVTRYGLADAKPHNEVAEKECPGSGVTKALRDWREHWEAKAG